MGPLMCKLYTEGHLTTSENLTNDNLRYRVPSYNRHNNDFTKLFTTSMKFRSLNNFDLLDQVPEY